MSNKRRTEGAKRKKAVAGFFIIMLLGILPYVNSTIAQRCWWMPFCTGDCMCSGEDIRYGDACNFTCLDEYGQEIKTCDSMSWPWYCKPIPPPK